MMKYVNPDPIDYNNPFENMLGGYFYYPLYACVRNAAAFIYNTIHGHRDLGTSYVYTYRD
jgi:hypothetical protein